MNGSERDSNDALRGIQRALQAKDVPALTAYAKACDSAGNVQVATQLWRNIYELKPTGDIALALGTALEKDGQDAAALEIYQHILKSVPDLAPVHVAAAQAAGRLGNDEAAIHHYSEATRLRPQDHQTALTLADLIQDTSMAEAAKVVAASAAANAHDPVEQARLLIRLTRLAEWAGRTARALPINHALDFNGFPFRYARDVLDALEGPLDRWVAADRTSSEALISRIAVHLAKSEFAAADKAMETFAKIFTKSGEARMRFLTTPPPSAPDLPKVVTFQQAPRAAGDALFLSCDTNYMKSMAVPLLSSLRRKSPGASAWLHVMGDDPDAVRVVAKNFKDLNLTVTFEDPRAFLTAQKMNPGLYFGAVRFIRFAEALRTSPARLWMLDVDALVNSDLSRMFAIDADVAFRIRPGRLEPWNFFSACLVMGRPRSPAVAYFDEVANIIAATLDKLWWGIDQYAMYGAYTAMTARGTMPPVTPLGPDHADVWDYAPDSSIWFTAGASKRQLMRNETPAEGTPPRRYADAYYAAQRTAEGRP